MGKEPQVSLFDLVVCLSDAVDLVCPALANHHKQVAYLAFSIGAELDLPEEQQGDLVLAGLLHDIGALSTKERLCLLQFDVQNPYQHAEVGYLFLKTFEPLSRAASLVRFHHVPWDEGRGSEFEGKQVPISSHIIHLADRVVVLIDKQQEVLGQVERIWKRIKEQSGKMFTPQLVDAFESLVYKEYIWLDVVSRRIDSILRRSLTLENMKLEKMKLNIEGLLRLANMFHGIIDFRSRYTATHSAGVAASAEALARLAGFSERECVLMKVAGNLHDLGKLAVPTEILEKPDKLTDDEFNIIRSHTFHTYRTLEPINDLDIINIWGSLHHERLDGSGYPFHFKGEDLSLGSKIMAVADVFTAIVEDRPYRNGMSSDKALQITQRMAIDSKLDPNIVSLLKLNFDEVNHFRMAAQAASAEEYKQLLHP